jgi:hypothetical protein
MHTETFEEINIDKRLINNADLMADGQIVEVMFHTEKETVLSAELPPIVDMEITYTPGKWIRFNESTYLIADNGERYPIQDVQGCNLGEKFIMPPSGRALFSVYFPPIEGKVTVLNYVEMDVTRGWNVRGIQVDKLGNK